MTTIAPAPEGTASAQPAGGVGARSRARRTWGALGGYLVAQAVVLLVLRALVPRFFWLDDQQAQYLPTFSWLGRTAEGGRPPLLDPELGSGGNFVADPQYGVLDPTHWLISWAVSRFDVALNAGWLLGTVAVLLLGTGMVLVLTVLRVPPAVAAAAAVGAASTGFFLWQGSSWWPVMWGTAWLPWLWLGLARRGWSGLLVTGLAAWQLTASGYPYVLLPAGALVAGHLLERRLARRHDGATRQGTSVVPHLLAGASGVLAGIPGLLGSQEMAAASTRAVAPLSAVGSTGWGIPNLLDIVVGGVTLTPVVSGNAGGWLFVTPLTATATFALPVLALVPWRQAARASGVVTALVLVGAALLLTQMPTDVGALRYPFRYLAVTGPAVAALAALSLRAAGRPVGRRVVLAYALVGAQLALALMRGPALLGWHVVAAVVSAVSLTAVLLYLRRGAPGQRVGRPEGRRDVLERLATRAAGALLVVSCTAAPLVALGAGFATERRIEAQATEPVAATGQPARQMLTRPSWGVTVDDFRRTSAGPGRTLTVLVYGAWQDLDEAGPADQGWAWGVLQGNANLFADFRTGFGYVAVGHDGWTDRLCQDLFGMLVETDECVAGLLEEVPDLDLTWVDAMSSDEVWLSPYTPAAVRQHFESTWRRSGSVGVFETFVRDDDLPGRVTSASRGVSVAVDGEPGDGQFRSGEPGESLRVSTPADGGRLVLRIPAWPGFRAEADGRPLAVGSIEDTLLTMELPGGLEDARVDLYFDPLADRLIGPAAVAGGLLLALAVVLEVVGRRHRGTRRPVR